MVHGLPGSGKTLVLKWIRSYFEEVWDFTLDHQFAFIAPLNSMAANIDGSTLHSWGELSFLDRMGRYISCKKKTEDAVTTVAGRGSTLRWLFIDEVEARGADLISFLSEKMQEPHVHRNARACTITSVVQPRRSNPI